MATNPRSVPSWQYEFANSAVPCLYCGNTERVVVVGEGRREVGVCEACAVHLYWIWRESPGDELPSGTTGRADGLVRVKVLIARRITLRGGEQAAPDHASSYQFGMVSRGDSLDLPTADIMPGEDESQAVSRALGESGVGTWSRFVEPLYTGHTPRGSLARVYLATACVLPAKGQEVARPLQWRDWPIERQTAGMATFYRALTQVWPLRLWKQRSLTAPSEVTVLVRRGAAEYIQLQQSLRAGEKDVDTSMAEYLRRQMTDDEKWVDKVLREHEEERAERDAEISALNPEPPAADASPGPTGFEEPAGIPDDAAGSDEDGTLEGEFAELPEGDDR